MSGNTVGKVTAATGPQMRQLSAWRALALQRMPYMASMLFSLRAVSAPGLGTVAVDNKHRLYVDFDVLDGKPARWCAEALLHECGHLFGEHHRRADELNVQPGERQLWNVCADAELNDDLRDAGLRTIADDGVLPQHLGQADYRPVEVYFAALRAHSDPQDADGGSGNTGQWEGCGSASGGQPAPCELDDTDNAGGGAEPISDIERQRVAAATAGQIRDHAKTAGNVPAGLVEQAELILTPSKTPWRRVLSATIRRAVASRRGHHDFTYTRRNRRAHRSRFILPGMEEPDPKIVVVRDTSGSMSTQELSTAISEVEGIAKQIGVRGDQLTVLDTDTEMAAERRYTTAASLALAEAAGRGGTNMAAGIDTAVKVRPRPQAVVVITDGFTPWPDRRPAVPVIVCLVGPDADSMKESCPRWATVVVVDDG